MLLQAFFAILASVNIASAVAVPNTETVADLKGLTYLGRISSGLTEGAFSNLYASEHYATFFEAAQYCESDGVDGKLVSVLTSARNQEIKTFLLNRSPTLYWTSGIYNDRSEVWVWYTENNLPLSYHNWIGGNPPNSPQPGECIYLNSDIFNYYWAPMTCTLRLFFLCEVPI